MQDKCSLIAHFLNPIVGPRENGNYSSMEFPVRISLISQILNFLVNFSM